ncbi:MAG: EF-hand protein [Alphaproteobacteria bacterium]|nr:EF-hand protein [Alphaproteobacteria bacterium]
MRPVLPALLLLASAAALAQPPAGPGRPGLPRAHGAVFLSPMGEPFRAADPAADTVGAWFAQADADHDGAIAAAEMQADAARFFATLDTDRNGEIDPAELARYENEVAPEVQLGMQMRERGFGRGKRPGGEDNAEAGGGAGANGGFDEGLEGAGRYSLLNIPEPVISADADLNRGVSRAEFLAAAARRFQLLDADHDGRLTRAELPPLPQRHQGKQKKRKGPPLRPQGEPLPL